MARLVLNTGSIDDYRTFLSVKRLPTYGFDGHTAVVPDEYAEQIGLRVSVPSTEPLLPPSFLFDYQRDIAQLAFRKKRFCIFADCGLGKTLIFLEWVRNVNHVLSSDKCILIVSPLMVITQTLGECRRFYGDEIEIEQIPSSELNHWLSSSHSRIGITNYEALSNPIKKGRLGALVLDESSMLKSHYGKWGTQCVQLGAGLEWKMAGTGTPAPNDRIEYANHAVFMDAFPSVNSFLARFFVNRGQTEERWQIKAHAIQPFYRALSHWCIFLTNPGTYGWKDNAQELPPIHIHMHPVSLTEEQVRLAYDATGMLFADRIGGITSRSVLSQIAKGSYKNKHVDSHKPAFIRDMLTEWPDESTIVWCLYNREQATLEQSLPDAGSISGSTPYEERMRIIAAFKAGTLRTLISKPKILGFGLNLQKATRQIFSGLQDSYESFYQAVKRSNRYGATYPLNVHIPYTDIEFPMIQNVLHKADRVAEDTKQQEELFRNASERRVVSH